MSRHPYRLLLFLGLVTGSLSHATSVITIELSTATPTNFLVRSSFTGLLNSTAGFGMEAELSETANSLTYTLTSEGPYDPRLVAALEANIASFFYPYTSTTTLTVEGTAYEGERLRFIQQDLSSVTASTGFTDVAFGAGKFLTLPTLQPVPVESIDYLISSDGLGWEKRNIPGYSTQHPVYYLNDRFMIAAQSVTTFQYVILYSADGETWQEVETPTFAQTLAYGDGKWVGINGSIGAYMVSTDGINWTGATVLPTLGGVNRMIYANDLWVAVGGGFYPDGCWTSTDGTNWAQVDPASLPGLVTTPAAYITGGKGLFFNYTASQSPAGGQTMPVDFENDLFFVSALGIYYSQGITGFIEADVEPELGFNSPNTIAYGNGRYVATGLFTGMHVADAVALPPVDPVSLWAGIEPINSQGDKETAIGLINDSNYPYIYHHGQGAYLWVFPGSTLTSLYGYDPYAGIWFFTNSDWQGWFHIISTGDWGWWW